LIQASSQRQPCVDRARAPRDGGCRLANSVTRPASVADLGVSEPGGANELAPRVRGDGGPHEIPNWALQRRLDWRAQ
jgi:hypothetical protein